MVAIVRHLGLREYAETFEQMRSFTASRTPEAADELWFLEHPDHSGIFNLGSGITYSVEEIIRRMHHDDE